jgi:signal peptidase I
VDKEGKPDVDFIRTFGVTVPTKHYFLLGDNHAMSLDGRVFGFIPEENMQGAPDLILWPPGSRWGAPPQKPYPFVNFPRLVVWSLVALVALIWSFIHYRTIWRPVRIVKD